MDRDSKIVDQGDIAFHTISEFEKRTKHDKVDRAFRENLNVSVYCERYALPDKGGVSAAILVIQTSLKTAGIM
eukprot:2589201-Karenia_brevis.AAC.1